MFEPTDKDLATREIDGLSCPYRLDLNNYMLHVKSSNWNRVQMAVLRVIALDKFPPGRIIPPKFLPSIGEGGFAYISALA